MIRISSDLDLPLEVVTETLGIVAQRGSGKTYLTRVLLEELVGAGLPAVVVDPMGVYWGARSSADGASEGLPVVVFGGDHGDVPLEPTSGAVIADWVVSARQSCILDLSGFRKGEQRRFVLEFSERLYQKNREPLHLILDEADLWAPQRPGPEQARLLGAVEDLVRRGRARGIGLSLVTQRPAVINKDVLTQVSVLVALRIAGPQDRKAIEEWIRFHGDAIERDLVLSSLGSLPIGTAWFWSPGWLQVLKRVRVRALRTFDSSATPKIGAKRIVPKRLAPVDIEALRAKIAETIERAEQDDPKALRAKIAVLEKRLAAQKQEPPRDLAAPLARTRAVMDQAAALGRFAEELYQALSELIRAPSAIPVELPPPPPRVTLEIGSAVVGRGEHTVLTAIAQHPGGAKRQQLVALCGYKKSTRDLYLQRLRGKGFIEQTADGRFVATGAGVGLLGPRFERLPVGAALREHWLNRLPEGEGRVLSELASAYPRSLTREQISARTGYKKSTRDLYLQRLASRELASVSAGEITARAELF